ncbi:MAG: hypothetical protein GY953_03120 [bacterium]|nr:hypothetical protein [bacterium]
MADFRSESPAGAEQVIIDRNTAPSLREGTYYIAFALLTRRLNVAARVTANLETSGAGETPRISTLAHGASQRIGPAAPGEIVAIYGSNIGPDTGVEARLTASGRLPTAVQATEVHFNGIPAPLLYVRQDQINVQVPYEVAGLDSAAVRVVHQGMISEAFTLSLTSSAPGIFMFLDGGNRAIVLNQDSTLNSAANPESPGRVVVFFATGEGLRTPSATSGIPAGGRLPLGIPELPVSVEIGGVQAQVLFAGAAPGYVGLLQVNARIPAAAPTGSNVPIVLRIGDSASPGSVSMSIAGN